MMVIVEVVKFVAFFGIFSLHTSPTTWFY